MVRHDGDRNLHRQGILDHLTVTWLEDVIRKCDFLEEDGVCKREEKNFVVHNLYLSPAFGLLPPYS